MSLFFSFLLSSAMLLVFAFDDISSIPRAAVLWILGLGIVNFLANPNAASMDRPTATIGLVKPARSFR